jgi:hypothetical protein
MKGVMEQRVFLFILYLSSFSRRIASAKPEKEER